MLDERILIIVPVLSLIGVSRYIYQILKGRARPNRVSFFLWGLAPIIAFAAQIEAGVGIQSVQTLMAGLCPLLIFAASFVNRRSINKLTTLDVVCGALSVLGLILWIITKEGVLAIFFSILADALAGVPTVVKSWRDPESESYLLYLFGSISATLTLLTIDNWVFEEYAFSLYLLLICLLLVVLVKFRLGTRLGASAR